MNNLEFNNLTPDQMAHLGAFPMVPLDELQEEELSETPISKQPKTSSTGSDTKPLTSETTPETSDTPAEEEKPTLN